MKHHYIAIIVGVVLGYVMYNWLRTFPIFSQVDSAVLGVGQSMGAGQ
jgi:hypothetical protein